MGWEGENTAFPTFHLRPGTRSGLCIALGARRMVGAGYDSIHGGSARGEILADASFGRSWRSRRLPVLLGKRWAGSTDCGG